MRIYKLRRALLKCLLNYRILFVYFMATSFLFMHYFVSSSSHLVMNNTIEAHDVNVIVNNNNFNSKKLLNIDPLNYEIPKQRRKRDPNTNISRLRNSRFVFNKLVIDPPSQLEYNLKNLTAEFYSQILQDRILATLLERSNYSRRYGGVFIEAGAYDGETWSNTLYLERYLNWTGLLIEPSVENYAKLRSKNRKSHLINTCLCGGRSSIKSRFIEAGPFGTISESSKTKSQVTCHPLARILASYFTLVNSTRIDYLSLDIEGNEKSIVESFPWWTHSFSFINIEFNQSNDLYEWLKTFLGQFGYFETVVDDVWFQDVYLAHKTVLNMNRVYKVSEFLI